MKRRKEIFDAYSQAFSDEACYQVPVYETKEKVSSYHVYPLRIKGITEVQRDEIMQHIFESEVAVNVHFIPLPMLSYYKNRGYQIAHYPVAYDNFSREISLPVYYDLTPEMVQMVIVAVKKAVAQVMK